MRQVECLLVEPVPRMDNLETFSGGMIRLQSLGSQNINASSR